MKGPRRALLVMKGAEAPGWKRRRRVTAKPRVRLRSGRNPGVSREQERALQGRRRVLKLTRKTCVALAGLISGFIPSRGLRPGLCCPALSALQLAFVGCAGLLGACRNGRAFSSLAAIGGGLPWVVTPAGLAAVLHLVPRAAPWALLCCPFRARILLSPEGAAQESPGGRRAQRRGRGASRNPGYGPIARPSPEGAELQFRPFRACVSCALNPGLRRLRRLSPGLSCFAPSALKDSNKMCTRFTASAALQSTFGAPQ